MRISVVVPFRNAESHLLRCLDALVHQEPFEGDREIVAIDDRLVQVLGVPARVVMEGVAAR